jgi:UDP-N-acetyl-2-amino-2-deoxyglucuronate dehydrogenase
MTSYRSISVDGENVEFSDGFTDLHTASYREILAGRGFGLDAVRPSVEIVSDFRKSPIDLSGGERHPLVAKHAAT